MFMLLVKYGCEHRCSGFHAMDDDGNKGLCRRMARGDSFERTELFMLLRVLVQAHSLFWARLNTRDHMHAEGTYALL